LLVSYEAGMTPFADLFFMLGVKGDLLVSSLDTTVPGTRIAVVDATDIERRSNDQRMRACECEV